MRTETSAGAGIDMRQFHAVFFEEADEHLAAMESLLVDIDITNPGEDALKAVFRAAHSIKGGAGTFGFADVSELTHEAETLLDRVRKGELGLTSAIVDTLLESGDALKLQLAVHRGDGGGAPEVAALVARLRTLCDSPRADDDLESRFAAIIPGLTSGELPACAYALIESEAPGAAGNEEQAGADEAFGFFDEGAMPAAHDALLAEEDASGAYGLFAAPAALAAR
ncbi:MAG: Hpt domain-containing protein [Burkholderiales bacterium]